MSERTEVTLTNEELYTALPLLREFSARPISMKLAYAIGKVKVELLKSWKLINQLHNELIEKYAEVDDGKRVVKDDSIVMTDQEAFSVEYKELMAEETVVNIYQVDYSALEAAFTTKTCDKCERKEKDVSVDEMATLVRLNIIRD